MQHVLVKSLIYVTGGGKDHEDDRCHPEVEAKILMDKLVGLANELGLLSEEYATDEKRMAGNFPQAFSHLTLVRAADAMHGVDRLSLAVDAAV